MKRVLIAFLLLLPLTAFSAEKMYAGIGLSVVNTNIEADNFTESAKIHAGLVGVETEESSLYPSIYGGFRLNEHWSIEGALKVHDYSFKILGDTEVVPNLTTVRDLEVELDTISLIVAPVFTLSITEGLSAYFSAGLHYWTTETTVSTRERSMGQGMAIGGLTVVTDFTIEESNSKTRNGADIYASVGVGYKVAKDIEIKLVAARLDSKIKSRGSDSVNADYQSFDIGATYFF